MLSFPLFPFAASWYALSGMTLYAEQTIAQPHLSYGQWTW